MGHSTEKTEELLRKAPRLKVPDELLNELKRDIRLPRDGEPGQAPFGSGSSLKRWLPAFSFSVLLLACLVAIAVQSSLLSELRRENQALLAESQDIAQLRQENQEYHRLRAQSEQLEQLRKDNVELQKLRSEVAQLREQTQQLTILRAENQRLLAEKKANESRTASGTEEDPFGEIGEAKKKAQSTACVNNLKQIGLGARMWANDHKDVLPPDFLAMRNELNTPKILVCPGDHAKVRTANWAEFGPANLSYEFLAPGISARESPNTVMTRCPLHGHVGLLDGSVHQSSPNFKIIQKDGKWVMERASYE